MKHPHLSPRKTGTFVLLECGDFSWRVSDCVYRLNPNFKIHYEAGS